jgi:hypothetical protein
MKQAWYNISEAFYKWVLNKRPGSGYSELWQNGYNLGSGMARAFLFLILVSLVAVLIYYFVVSKKPINATIKNYLITCLIGYVTLVVVNIVALKLITKAPIELIFSINMLWVCIVDILYYLVFFELFSLCFKKLSNAPHIDLIGIFKK